MGLLYAPDADVNATGAAERQAAHRQWEEGFFRATAEIAIEAGAQAPLQGWGAPVIACFRALQAEKIRTDNDAHIEYDHAVHFDMTADDSDADCVAKNNPELEDMFEFAATVSSYRPEQRYTSVSDEAEKQDSSRSSYQPEQKCTSTFDEPEKQDSSGFSYQPSGDNNPLAQGSQAESLVSQASVLRTFPEWGEQAEVLYHLVVDNGIGICSSGLAGGHADTSLDSVQNPCILTTPLMLDTG